MITTNNHISAMFTKVLFYNYISTWSSCFLTENTSYSDTEDRHSPLRPFDGKFWRFNAERSESMMCFFTDTGKHAIIPIILYRDIMISSLNMNRLKLSKLMAYFKQDLQLHKLW